MVLAGKSWNIYVNGSKWLNFSIWDRFLFLKVSFYKHGLALKMFVWAAQVSCEVLIHLSMSYLKQKTTCGLRYHQYSSIVLNSGAICL